LHCEPTRRKEHGRQTVLLNSDDAGCAGPGRSIAACAVANPATAILQRASLIRSTARPPQTVETMIPTTKIPTGTSKSRTSMWRLLRIWFSRATSKPVASRALTTAPQSIFCVRFAQAKADAEVNFCRGAIAQFLAPTILQGRVPRDANLGCNKQRDVSQFMRNRAVTARVMTGINVTGDCV